MGTQRWIVKMILIEEKSGMEDINGESHLLFGTTKDDMEESSLFNISKKSQAFLE
jgi:hypothetical protein